MADDQEFPDELMRECRDAPDAQRISSLYNKILSMGVSDKIKLATLGNKEARGILIKDSNNAVVQAVMASPKLTEEELVTFAGNRNLSREVNRIISSKREFLKSYPVKLALVNNPKTPPAKSLQLLTYLRESDLKNLSKSRNVPGVIATSARKLLQKRGR